MLEYLLNAMEERLAPAGFRRIHDQDHPRAFGSRVVVWAGPDRVLRLVWDGKEEWVVLEGRSSNGMEWQELHLERVRRDGIDEKGRAVLVAALEKWLFGSGSPAA